MMIAKTDHGRFKMPEWFVKLSRIKGEGIQITDQFNRQIPHTTYAQLDEFSARCRRLYREMTVRPSRSQRKRGVPVL